VAHDVIQGRANGLRETLVIQGRGDGILRFGDESVANLIEFAGRDTRLDVVADHIQDVCRKPAGDAHFVLFLGVFDGWIHMVDQGREKRGRREVFRWRACRSAETLGSTPFSPVRPRLALLGISQYGIKRAP
jgi:hypothetical protein